MLRQQQEVLREEVSRGKREKDQVSQQVLPSPTPVIEIDCMSPFTVYVVAVMASSVCCVVCAVYCRPLRPRHRARPAGSSWTHAVHR